MVAPFTSQCPLHPCTPMPPTSPAAWENTGDLTHRDDGPKRPPHVHVQGVVDKLDAD